MNRVISSFKSSIELLGKNPWIIGIVFVIYIYTLPFSKSLEILFDFSLPPKFILPFAIIIVLIASYAGAGFIGIVKEVLEGIPNPETFTLEGRKHFLSLLMGIIIFFILCTVFFLGVAISIEYLGIFPFLAEMNVPEQRPILDFLILFSPALFAVFFLQFFDVGIVVDGYGVLNSFKRSIKFVWSRKLSVLGYDLISTLLALLLMSYSIRMNLLSLNYKAYYAALPMKAKVLRVIIILFLSTIHGALQGTYHIIYYIQSRGDDSIHIRP